MLTVFNLFKEDKNAIRRNLPRSSNQRTQYRTDRLSYRESISARSREIVIQTRGQGGARRLLVSIAAGTPRVHFIETARENPAVPPMFCMLLRKHVQGAKIAAVTQPAVERMLSIELDTTDEMGVACKKHLICELMGKHSQRCSLRRG